MVMHSRTSAWKPCCWMCWIIDFNETICFNPMAMLDDTDDYITKQKNIDTMSIPAFDTDWASLNPHSRF